jgi:hypothetical protein
VSGLLAWRDGRSAGGVVNAPSGGAIGCGTLTCELDLVRGIGGQLLFARGGLGPGVLSLHAGEDGVLTLAHRAGARNVVLTLGSLPGPAILTYRWNAGRGWCDLSLSQEDGQSVRLQDGVAPPPLDAGAVPGLVEAGAEGPLGVTWLTLHEGILPLGPGAWVAWGTALPGADALCEGQSLTGIAGRAAKVVWAGPVRRPGLGLLRPVILRAPFFDRARDIVVEPSARLRLSGREVEYLFGQTEILVRARDIVNGQTVTLGEARPDMVWQGLVLDRPEVIALPGCELAAPNIGRLARYPQLANRSAMGLVAARGQLPLHGPDPLRLAAPYEAAALAQAMMRRFTPVAA